MTTEAIHLTQGTRRLRQLPRAFRAFWSVLSDRMFLNLPEHQRPQAAADLDDASLAKWARWALVNTARVYSEKAKRDGRSLSEVTTMHATISLALMTLEANATSATFEVDGVTFRGEEKGDWRVTIEQISPSSEPTP